MFVLIIDADRFGWQPVKQFLWSALKWLFAGYVLALHWLLMGF